jgi:DNA-binding winged helix-turn-helix (wHTH) protein
LHGESNTLAGMHEIEGKPRYRFGVFEADTETRELRRSGVRVRLHAQPFQILAMLLARPGELLTRDEIVRELWPDGTFVDYDHGLNSAVNRLREALSDTASQPRYVETLSRRGYRFVALVERMDPSPAMGSPAEDEDTEEGFLAREETEAMRILATVDDLPAASPRLVRTLFALLQGMYLGFYVGALANLGEIEELVAVLPKSVPTMTVLIVTAAVLIPIRGLAAANEGSFPAVDQNFGRTETAVVVGALRHAAELGSGVEDGEQIAWLNGRKLAVACEEVTGLADRAYDVDGAP